MYVVLIRNVELELLIIFSCKTIINCIKTFVKLKNTRKQYTGGAHMENCIQKENKGMIDIKLRIAVFLGEAEDWNQEGNIGSFAQYSFYYLSNLDIYTPCYPDLFWFLSLVGNKSSDNEELVKKLLDDPVSVSGQQETFIFFFMYQT